MYCNQPQGGDKMFWFYFLGSSHVFHHYFTVNVVDAAVFLGKTRPPLTLTLPSQSHSSCQNLTNQTKASNQRQSRRVWPRKTMGSIIMLRVVKLLSSKSQQNSK